MTEPHYQSGKICYIEMPSVDARRSADFYRQAFGWNIRTRGDGHIAFDDTVGQVSGSWVSGRQPLPAGTLVVYIMVGDAPAAAEAVVRAGGEIVKPVDPAEGETYFHFKDLDGNVMGVYQQPGLKESEG